VYNCLNWTALHSHLHGLVIRWKYRTRKNAVLLPEERVILTTDMEEDQDAADQEHDLHGADGSIFEINDFTNATPWER